MKITLAFASIAILGLTCGCATNGVNMPLVFGQSHTVGVSMSGTTADQGVDLTVGYKDKDIAIVPVTVKQANGDSTLIKSTAENHQDALSVLGQFELNTDAKQAEVGLGKFFATGLAAKKLADGFAHKMGLPKKTQQPQPSTTGNEE
ncbi:hypothetical protein L2750_09350 [Shewanella submarina]|uniref:Uncharacterized protein n=1 Tax=Shewanella submarina TaxID=2016376 RepID=A0ABV7G9U6_9GAMM|nr:hypothetical protein [Shewanella submarina]MCL1037360.1 hypothetical protein [Shewanella submarina]